MVHPRWTISALALVAAFFLGAGIPLRAQNREGFPYGDLKEVRLQGTLFSVADELARKYGARAAGGGPEKQWALALPDGQVYTFLDNEQYRKLLAAKLTHVEVEARHFPRSMLLEITAFRSIPGDALKRRFFCSVCTIYGEDWGPCVCCGKEMELLPR